MGIYSISKLIREIMSEIPPPDERELTRRLINLTSQNHHYLHYQISQRLEVDIGADWLWLIVTNSGITPLLIQAKKLKDNEKHISKRAIGYKSQIVTLLQQSERTGIPALYVLFSNFISNVPCRNSKLITQEGVFIDSANNLYNYLKSSNKSSLKHLPISCFFSCITKKCHYNILSEVNHRVCKVCNGCEYTNCWNKNNRDFKCPTPITKFLSLQYSIKCTSFPVSLDLLPLIIAHSVLCDKTSLVLVFFRRHMDSSVFLPSDVIITDYMHRHGDDYLQNVFGGLVSFDTTRVYKKSFIISVLENAVRKYPLFEKIGLFGSYSRGEATPSSDIDIALVYQKDRFRKKEDIDLLCSFISEMVKGFKKKIDFIDYNEACANRASRGFIAEINQDMHWIDPKMLP